MRRRTQKTKMRITSEFNTHRPSSNKQWSVWILCRSVRGSILVRDTEHSEVYRGISQSLQTTDSVIFYSNSQPFLLHLFSSEHSDISHPAVHKLSYQQLRKLSLKDTKISLSGFKDYQTPPVKHACFLAYSQVCESLYSSVTIVLILKPGRPRNRVIHMSTNKFTK